MEALPLTAMKEGSDLVPANSSFSHLSNKITILNSLVCYKKHNGFLQQESLWNTAPWKDTWACSEQSSSRAGSTTALSAEAHGSLVQIERLANNFDCFLELSWFLFRVL